MAKEQTQAAQTTSPVTARTNYTVTKEGTDLIIRVPLGFAGEPSASGKRLLVASTGGFKDMSHVGGGLELSMNLTRPNPNKP